jgi:2-dehydro-3-deoxy-L-rhamnonate dehydrogenase (NAD+)
MQAAVGSQYHSADPKVVEQEMIGSTPMRRFGSVEEVIGVVAYLFSDDSSYITGMDHTVTGGII